MMPTRKGIVMELGLTVILTEPPPLPHVPYTGTDRHPWLGKMREETFADWLRKNTIVKESIL
jgi:hypothetical protein